MLCSELSVQATVARSDSGHSLGEGTKPLAGIQAAGSLQPFSDRALLYCPGSTQGSAPLARGVPLYGEERKGAMSRT